MAAELAGKFVHTDSRAVTALETAHAQDPSPAVRLRLPGSGESLASGAWGVRMWPGLSLLVED
jgi:hypothetical protein